MSAEAWGVAALTFEGVFFLLLQEPALARNRLPEMRVLAKFLKDAGYYGIVTVLLAIILFAVSIREHANNKNVDTWWLWSIVIVLWSYGCGVAWYKEYTAALRKGAEIETVKSPVPLIKGVLSNFRFGGTMSTGNVAG